MSRPAEVAALLPLLAGEKIDRSLAVHLTLLLDAGCSLLVAGPREPGVQGEIAAAFSAASPLPRADVLRTEIVIGAGHNFSWLADPTGIGCVTEGAGSAPRAPREVRLRMHEIFTAPEPATVRTTIRALARGYTLIADGCAASLAEILEQLRSGAFRVPEADIRRMGLVVLTDEERVTSCHLLQPSETGSDRPPTLLSAWDADQQGWDDFAWAAIPELAERCRRTHAEYAAQHAARLATISA